MRIQYAIGVAGEDCRNDSREIARLENDSDLVRSVEVGVVQRDFTLKQHQIASGMRAVPADNFKAFKSPVGKWGSQQIAQVLLIGFGKDEAGAE